MAEICCEEAKSPPTTVSAAAVAAAVSASSAAAAVSSAIDRRRRRMEMRRFRIASDLELATGEDARPGKRQRLARTVSGATGSDGDSVSQRPSCGCTEEFPRYGVTAVCGRRREMEDAVSIRPDFLLDSGKHHFYGVFDGHGCSHVATACQERMHELVAEEHSKAGSGEVAPWKDVMERSFARMDGEVANRASTRSDQEPDCPCEQQTPSRRDHAGSTAVVAVVTPTQVVVANAGDSRAVLSRAGVPVALSVDHKPDRPDELERIEAAGGRVIYWDGARVLGVLAMSRAIGDGYLKPYVTSEPEVTVTERTDDDECLILASDGLWDVVTNEMACEVVKACFHNNGPPAPAARPVGVPPSAEVEAEDGDASVKGINRAESDKACSDAAMLLTKLALARRSADNVSVVVVDLRRGF
ncbi:probable protein phosphatase 2C 9 [Oryza brachyantha]|uniref:protein-serine/threonine phosphatase n=1 Tax=Oryza brachyantha TaxID=4533 RepID=J3L5S6_ORYBR|nr:probable protein phosphatase 2C 9 [Oryza brachyantha]